jgi:hypothetical protein
MSSPTPTDSFGTVCARRAIEAKKAFAAAGTIFSQRDLAKLIDDTQRETIAAHDGKDVPPPPEAVTIYSASIGYPLDGRAFCDSYAQKGWIVSGKARMKDWKAAVRNWKANNWGRVLETATPQLKADYSRF